ncbi:MAG: metalloregulator ArsR/SmtB family transcription factor [Caldilineaceae bacterium]
MSNSLPLETLASATETADEIADETVTMGCCGPILPLQLTDDAAGELSTVFKALANPVRLQMLDILNRRAGEVCVCDIEGHFDLSQPTISHHLRALRQAGLVDAEQRGTWIYYRARRDDGADAGVSWWVLLLTRDAVMRSAYTGRVG